MAEILLGENYKSICVTSKALKLRHLKLLREPHKQYLM